MESISILFVGFLSSLFGIQTIDHRAQEALSEYTCAPHVWVKEPAMTGSNLDATISAECSFLGTGGGGYKQLEAALRARIEKEALTIHSGPTEETYKNLPSSYYDATFLLTSSNGDQAEMRQDMHVASNLETTCVFDSVSTSVKATGNFEHLKKLDILTTVTDGKEPQWYNLKMESTFKLSKPWYAPKGVFVKEVKKMIEAEIPKTEEQLISEIAPNI